jgi:hypothetical protein
MNRLALIAVLLLASCSEPVLDKNPEPEPVKREKYLIKDARGETYVTDEFYLDQNTVRFKDTYRGERIIVSGNFTIEKK